MIEGAEADTDAEICLAAKELNQGNREFAGGDWVFASLEIHVRDGCRKMMEKEFCQLIEFCAISIQIAIGTTHSAVVAILAAEIGEFDHGAHEDFVAKMGSGGGGGAFVERGLFAVARQ